MIWSCKAMAGQEKGKVGVTSLIARLELERINGFTIESENSLEELTSVSRGW